MLILAPADLSSLGAILRGWHSQDPWKGTSFPLIFEQRGMTPGPRPTSQRQAALLEPRACQEAELSATTGPWRGEAVSGQLAALRRSVLFALVCISEKALGKEAFLRSYCSLGRK